VSVRKVKRAAHATEAVTFVPIGRVKGDFDVQAMPEEIAATESHIVLDADLVEGLTGVEAGRQAMVIFHFHKIADYELLQHPRGDSARPKRGVFALHTPFRPNPIGVTVVDVLAVEGNVLRVRGLDALDGSPVLDIKLV
jgi:tRNA-Thr(GGU) m(6)t(6)A37 methyltransferase TsaA